MRLLGLLAGGAAFLAVLMIREIVTQEYDGWAPSLARRLVRLAGLLYPPRAREWEADVRYLQDEEGETGLWEALSHATGAPKLAALELARSSLARLRRPQSDHKLPDEAPLPAPAADLVQSEDVRMLEEGVLRLSSRANPSVAAAAMLETLRARSAVEVQVVGAGALNQAVKAIAIARGHAGTSQDLVMVPTFADISIDGQTRTAIRLLVHPRSAR